MLSPLAFVLRRRLMPARLAFFDAMARMQPDALNETLNQILDHMLRGTDREDKDSVGGWSQRELDMFVGTIQPFLPPGATERTCAAGRAGACSATT